MTPVTAPQPTRPPIRGPLTHRTAMLALSPFTAVASTHAPDIELAVLRVLGVLFVVGLIAHSLMVRRLVKHRTAALEASRNELAAMNRRLQEQATHDLLTGLANRRLFIERVNQTVAAARRSGDRFGVLYLDLDDFKAVNDRWGHGVGDDVLVTIGERISRSVRQADTAARLGGDEFAVLVDRIDGRDDLHIVAGKLAVACSRPQAVGRDVDCISASVGLAMFPGDGSDADALLAVADRSMYRAKMRAKGLEILQETPAPSGIRQTVSD